MPDLTYSDTSLDKAAPKEIHTSALSGSEALKILRNEDKNKISGFNLKGISLIALGCLFLVLSCIFKGSDLNDFLTGLFMGISVALNLTGVYITTKCLAENKKSDKLKSL